MIQHKFVIIKSKKETFKYLFKSSNPLIPVVFQIVPSIVTSDKETQFHSPYKTNIPTSRYWFMEKALIGV